MFTQCNTLRRLVAEYKFDCRYLGCLHCLLFLSFSFESLYQPFKIKVCSLKLPRNCFTGRMMFLVFYLFTLDFVLKYTGK